MGFPGYGRVGGVNGISCEATGHVETHKSPLVAQGEPALSSYLQWIIAPMRMDTVLYY